MPGLISELFRGDQRLEDCLIKDQSHVTRGATGTHVAKIQYAVMVLTGVSIDGRELKQRLYGADTAARVKAYKTKRRIINFSYQTTADDIVGKMTIAALDLEMSAYEVLERMPRPRFPITMRIR